MERHSRLQAILEGKFLSLQSDVSAMDRPFVNPVHDPEKSNAPSESAKEMAVSVYAASSIYEPSETSTVTDFALLKQPYKSQKPSLHPTLQSIRDKSAHGVVVKCEPVNPPPYVSPRRWPERNDSLQPPPIRASRRFSVTPTFIYSVPDHDNHANLTSRNTICEQPGRISPMHVVQLPGRFTDKAPTEKTMAWLQVLAGFFVVMNAQGLNQSYGVFQAYYETVLLRTQSPSTIAWIGSLQIFLLFFMSIFVSTQMDK
ncbi:MAG: hypothetical protein LQ337_008933, partial [Flavoplaca oasis]